MLDKDMALRSGRPPCINDDDCNVELPDENPLDGIGNVPLFKSKGKFNLFRTMVTFSVIQSKVYMQLYSARAARQSDGELLNTIGELDKELEEWRDTVPAEFSPDNEAFTSSPESNSTVMHFVLLHFAYYNCLTTIHRMSIHHGYWTSRLSNYAISGLSAKPLNPRVFSSAALCVSAARASINMIKYLDPKDYPCIWYVKPISQLDLGLIFALPRLVMYYPVSALVTLFANILQNPQDPRARVDLTLMHSVIDFLHSVLELDELDDAAMKFDDCSVNRMLTVCGEFTRIATLVLDKADKEVLSKRKRKSEGPARPARSEQRPPTVSVVVTATPPEAVASNAPNGAGVQPNGLDMNSQV